MATDQVPAPSKDDPTIGKLVTDARISRGLPSGPGWAFPYSSATRWTMRSASPVTALVADNPDSRRQLASQVTFDAIFGPCVTGEAQS